MKSNRCSSAAEQFIPSQVHLLYCDKGDKRKDGWRVINIEFTFLAVAHDATNTSWASFPPSLATAASTVTMAKHQPVVTQTPEK